MHRPAPPGGVGSEPAGGGTAVWARAGTRSSAAAPRAPASSSTAARWCRPPFRAGCDAVSPTPVDQQLLIGERLSRGVALLVEPGGHGLQRVAEPPSICWSCCCCSCSIRISAISCWCSLFAAAAPRMRDHERQGNGHDSCTGHGCGPRPSSVFRLLLASSIFLQAFFLLARHHEMGAPVLGQAPSSWPGSNGNSLP